MLDNKDNTAQKNSHAFRLPALDPEFLLGDSTRGVRFMLEYAKAEERLREAGIASTIVVFGSARVHPEGQGKYKQWYEDARQFAYLVSKEGGALDGNGGHRQNVIATGGGPGFMEAANRGATEAGAPSIGFNITLPFEQEPNGWSTPELTFRFHYFAMRKMHLAMRAAALVVFPGGFGTLDEMFEVLTLRQTGKMPDCPVVLFDKDYWTSVINFQVLVDHGMVDPQDVDLFSFTNTPQEAWKTIAAYQKKIKP